MASGYHTGQHSSRQNKGSDFGQVSSMSSVERRYKYYLPHWVVVRVQEGDAGKIPSTVPARIGPKSVFLESRYSGDTHGQGRGVQRRPSPHLTAYLPSFYLQPQTLGEGSQVRTGT